MNRHRLVMATVVALVLVGTSCSASTPGADSQPGTIVITAPETTTTTVPPTTTTTTAPAPTTTTTTVPWEPTFPVIEESPPLAGIPEFEFALDYGSKGPMVSMLQERLTDASLYRGAIDGEYGDGTAQAVMALHKLADVERSWHWSHDDWQLVADVAASFPSDRVPARDDEPNRVEIDLSRQLLYLVVDGEVEAVIPVSSGNGASYVNSAGNNVRAKTPRGDFTIGRHIDGLHMSYLGAMWSPWYFRGGYAVHGSSSVPAQPASHGCVRVPKWEAEYLNGVLDIGLPLHVWD